MSAVDREVHGGRPSASTGTRAADAMDDVNVVMVLSESFSDPEALAGVHLAEDPIPFTRRLMYSTDLGSMLAKGTAAAPPTWSSRR